MLFGAANIMLTGASNIGYCAARQASYWPDDWLLGHRDQANRRRDDIQATNEPDDHRLYFEHLRMRRVKR